ncbi:MAG: hypothetical protein JXR78_04890 [Victivallales bacterium]|nr:hypothetical protein [Victivallales bacterium]
MKKLSIGSYQSAAVYDRPLYGKLSQKAFNYEGPERNPVIVIHGFLGSRLRDNTNDRIIWGKFEGIKALEFFPEDDLRLLSFPMSKGALLKDLKNNVVGDSLLDKIELKLLGMSFHLNAYDGLINTLRQAGYKDNNSGDAAFRSLYVFEYDWRRDLSENAVRLHAFVQEKRRHLKDEYQRLYGLDDYDVRFDIVAHSMGGLLARYYLRYGGNMMPNDGSSVKLNWKGCAYVNKLIMLGTPNMGYLDTCIELVNGYQIAPGTGIYPPGVIGTFPSYYQMMPLPETRSLLWKDNPDGAPVDVYDPQVWKAMGWGLASPTQDKVLKYLLPDVSSSRERKSIAFEHLSKCLARAKQFAELMKTPGEPPEDVAKFLFLGDAVQTRRTALVDRASGKIEVAGYEPGDGKVLAASAVFDRRDGGKWKLFMDSPIKWHSIYHLPAAHMGITTSATFADNLTYCLLSMPNGSHGSK